MIKKLKKLAIVSAVCSIPVGINKLIFKRYKKNDLNKSKENVYEWKFGNIRYAKIGSGKPLLLIHGMGLGRGKHEWYNNIEELSEHYCVYAFDMLGYGASDKPGMTYSPYLFIQLINDFIKDIIGEKVYVAATTNSAGYAVASYSFEPENFEKMLLISPTGVGSARTLPSENDKWLQKVLDSPYIGSTIYNIINSKIGLRHYLSTYAFSDIMDIDRKLIKKYHKAAHLSGADSRFVISAFLTNDLNMEIETFLEKVKIPIHLAWGEKNITNTVENASYIKKINPNIKLTIFKNTKELLYYENSKEFNKVLMDFMD